MFEYIIITSFLFLIFIVYKIYKYLSYCEYFEDSTIGRAQQLNRNNLPFNPNGWFAVLESNELKCNQIKAVFAFGNDIVVYRGSTGEITVLDAYCPHLGANLGIGGQVIGDSVKCPFHGWVFDNNGICTHVPGIECSNLPKIKVWISYEINGIIFVWHHMNDEKPDWNPTQIKELEEKNLVCRGKYVCIFRSHIRDVIENGVDEEHLDEVHNKQMANLATFMNYSLLAKYLIKFNKIDSKLTYNSVSDTNKHVYTVTLNSSVNFIKSMVFKNTYMFIGPGITFLKETNGQTLIYTIITVTPIEDNKLKLTCRTYSGNSLKEKLFAKLIFVTIKTFVLPFDIVIWNQRKELTQPYLTSADNKIVEIRRWFRQFIDNNSVE